MGDGKPMTSLRQAGLKRTGKLELSFMHGGGSMTFDTEEHMVSFLSSEGIDAWYVVTRKS